MAEYFKLFFGIIVIIFAIIGLCKTVDHFLTDDPHTVEYRIEHPVSIVGDFKVCLPEGIETLRFPYDSESYRTIAKTTIYSLKFKTKLPFQARITTNPYNKDSSYTITILLDNKPILRSTDGAAVINLMGKHKCFRIPTKG